MKKKWSILILFLILILTPNVCLGDEVDFDIHEYEINAYITSDGSMNVEELITYVGSFNGQFWSMVFSDSGHIQHTANTSDLKGHSPLYDARDITNINVFKLKDSYNGIGKDKYYTFSQVNSGSGQIGDNLVYEMDKDSRKLGLKMFFPTHGDQVTILIQYRLEDVVVVHNDVAEVYWNFIGSEWEEPLNNVTVNITLPEESENLRIFAHGPLEGASEITSPKSVQLKIDEMYPGEVLDGRLLFSPTLVPDAVKTTNLLAEGEILNIEKVRAEDANAQREKDKNRILVGNLVGGIFIGLNIVLLVYIYLKYDKEFKPSFWGKYYRELPNDYGPAVMSYNYFNKRIETKDLTATIFDMVRLKIFKLETIKVEKKKLFRTTEEEDFLLKDNTQNRTLSMTSEQEYIFHWLIEKIGDGSKVSFDEIEEYTKSSGGASQFYDDYDIWTSKVEGRAKKYNFFDPNSKRGVAIGVITGAIGLALSMLLLINASYYPIVILFPLSIFTFVFSIRIKRRTQFGADEYAKWKAFKNFINDFSLIKDATPPSVVIWEHYLVYAISLGIADKVIKELELVLRESDFNNPNLTFLYGYSYGSLHSFNRMNTRLDSVTRSSFQAAMTQHSSSTGGGGGFSSGGGGGGGGGSGGGGF